MNELDLLKEKTITLLLTARFNQNHGKDGRFTTGGGSNKSVGQQVAESTANVKSKLSNKANPIQREAVDMADVKERGGVTDEQAEQCVAVAQKLYDQAEAKEPTITSDVISAVEDQGGQMYGLDHRMKQPTSMAGKIGADSNADGVSFEEAGANIKDSVRYTAVIDEGNFTNGYENIKATLESKGYTEIRCKNFYEMYENNTSCQKAVQCVYADESGFTFEFQFHTPSSQGAKELNHPLYEKQRKATTSTSEKRRLDAQMRDIGSYVPNPSGVMSIKSHK